MINILYDVFCSLFSFALSIFFREICARGRHNVPPRGPVIFVVGPHHNQFVDPVVLMKTNSRRISFLAAEVSMRRPIIGPLIRAFGAIGVQRYQDSAKASPFRLALANVDGADFKDRLRILGNKEAEDLKTPLFIASGSIIFVSGAGKSDPLQVAEYFPDEKEIRLSHPITDPDLLRLFNTSKEGVKFKVAPQRKCGDSEKLYNKVYMHLAKGGCIGIFPEGGSHDRSELLPFKPGFAIMALSAMARTPHLDVKIVPVGLSYFNAHRFRSRAVIEYGAPITVPQRLVAQYAAGGMARRSACKALLDVVLTAVLNITVTAPDYSTLMVAQAVRRLYHPLNKRLTLVQKLEFTRRLVRGYLNFKDDPRLRELERKVLSYNKQLEYHGLRDHQVERTATLGLRALALLLFRIPLLTLMAVIALPGTIINLPIAFAADRISKQKAKEALAASSVKIAGRDVLATWKVLVAVGLTPVVYVFYIVSSYFIVKYAFEAPSPWPIGIPILVSLLLPYISLIAISFGEVGADIYKSLAPLTFSVLPTRWGVSQSLRHMRAILAHDLNQIINELGPNFFPHFEHHFLEDTVIQTNDQTAAGLTLVSSWVSSWLVSSEVDGFSNEKTEIANDTDHCSSWSNSYDLTRFFLSSSSSTSSSQNMSSASSSICELAADTSELNSTKSSTDLLESNQNSTQAVATGNAQFNNEFDLGLRSRNV